LQQGAKSTPANAEISSQVALESSPLYEDFMPDKEGAGSSSLQENASQVKQSGEPLLTKEDWIEVLAGALGRTHQLWGEKRKRSRSKDSEEEEGEEEDSQSLRPASKKSSKSKDESSKALGSLSSAIVDSGAVQAGKKTKASARSSEEVDQQKHKSAKKTGAESAAWKKKLAALQKAQQQLSGKIAALVHLAD